MKIDKILIKPILTEKATNLLKENFYSFEVYAFANKFQIKESIEKLYKVKVSEIKVSLKKGKIKKVGRRMMPKQLANKKIARVKLKTGKIDLFPQS